MMKKLAAILLAGLLCMACAGAETLDLTLYAGYTGEPIAESARWIENIMTANDIRANLEKFGALEQKTYVSDGEAMSIISDDILACRDGVYVRRIIEDPAIDIYVAGETAYMIENGAIYTMPVANIPDAAVVVDEFVFVYDENEHVCGLRDWENGQVVLTRAEDTWLEYFLDSELFICAIKVYNGAENPECTVYVTVEPRPDVEIPSFIVREALK